MSNPRQVNVDRRHARVNAGTTVRDWAVALATINRNFLVLAAWPGDYRTRGQVAAVALPYMGKVTVAEVESALELLLEMGLVEAQRREVDVTPSNPQGYRWSRRATVDRLNDFVDRA